MLNSKLIFSGMATASIFHLWSESEAFIWFGFYANTDEVQAVQLCFKWIYSIQSCSLIHFTLVDQLMWKSLVTTWPWSHSPRLIHLSFKTAYLYVWEEGVVSSCPRAQQSSYQCMFKLRVGSYKHALKLHTTIFNLSPNLTVNVS